MYIIFIYFDRGRPGALVTKTKLRLFRAKKRHLSPVSRPKTPRLVHRNRCFIPPYSLITMEANSTNGFLTISQMMKE